MRSLSLLFIVTVLSSVLGQNSIFNSSNCTAQSELFVTAYQTCLDNVTNLTAQYNNLFAGYTACGCGVDPCALVVPVDYNLGLHIAAVFIILVASAVGVAIPLLAKYIQRLGVPPYFVTIGKCAGTGVILACALVHMIQPSNQSLTSPCVPTAFNTDYQAYAYLFAMIAAFLMHFLDFLMSQYFNKKQLALSASISAASSLDGYDPFDKSSDSTSSTASHGHSHGSLLELEGQEWNGKKLAEAYMIEFGVTVHSLFIGLAVGIVDYGTLVALLVALSFHQFFEGFALGARLSDANMNHLNELLLASVFSLAAPIGIAIGLGVYTTLNTAGQTFLLVQGTFDGLCGGILLYTGFTLLLFDFPRDMLQCTGKYRTAMIVGMFASLWIAAGLMAFIGKYL
jgi:zinc transporter 1/2/3